MERALTYTPALPRGLSSLIAAALLLIPIGIWNSAVFEETNLPLLLALMIITALVFVPGGIPRGVHFPAITFSFLLFTLYCWLRLDERWDFTGALYPTTHYRPGIAFVVDMLLFYLLFIVSAVLFYRKMRLSLWLWFLICGYMVAYMARNSFDIQGLQDGYNLSPGFVIVTFMPFAFLRKSNAGRGGMLLPTALLAVCALWLALIGARTAFGALAVFYFVILAWPLIARNRFFFFGAFWGMVLLIVVLNVVYVMYAGGERDSVVEGSDWGIFQKSIDTRTEIWIHLLYLILQEPLFGYGTSQSTATVGALPFLEFTFNRPNLSAHSTYYELLYRLGLVGLAGLVLILFSIWRLFWTGRNEWAVRVAAAFLLTMLFFSTTGDNLVFSAQQLRNGFAWIALGIGAGACLRVVRNGRITARAVNLAASNT